MKLGAIHARDVAAAARRRGRRGGGGGKSRRVKCGTRRREGVTRRVSVSTLRDRYEWIGDEEVRFMEDSHTRGTVQENTFHRKAFELRTECNSCQHNLILTRRAGLLVSSMMLLHETFVAHARIAQAAQSKLVTIKRARSDDKHNLTKPVLEIERDVGRVEARAVRLEV